MRRARISAPLAALAALGLALAGCTASSEEDTGPVTVRVGTLLGQAEYFAPFYYEEFTSGGLQVEIVPEDSQAALSDAISAGSIDFALMNVVPTLSAVAAERDLVIVADAIEEGTSFVAREGYDSLDQLVGRPIGYVAGTQQEVMLRLLITDAGLDPATMKLVPVAANGLFGQFQSGALAAFIGPELDGVLARQAGAHDLVDPFSTEVGALNVVLVTDSRHIAQQSEVVQNVVDAHTDALAWMAENTQNWVTKLVSSFGGDAVLTVQVAGALDYTSALPSSFTNSLTVLAEELAATGVITSTPAMSRLIDTDFVTGSDGS